MLDGFSGWEQHAGPHWHSEHLVHSQVRLRCEVASVPCPAGPGEDDCTPCTPDTSAPHWRCVPACREGFYPADSHGLPNKVCKRYGSGKRTKWWW